MMKEAESNAAEDTKRKEEIEVRNQTDSLVYSTERTLGEHGAKLAEIMYRETQEPPQPGGAGRNAGTTPGGPKEGEVVDAEFEDLGDKK